MFMEPTKVVFPSITTIFACERPIDAPRTLPTSELERSCFELTS